MLDIRFTSRTNSQIRRSRRACGRRTPKTERDAILARLASGETEVVCNCMVLTEGFDLPAIGCIVLARPTKQIGLFRQMAGRGLRPAPGKSNLILIDHSGAVYRHGLLEDRIEWTLQTDKRATNPVHESRDQKAVSRLIECSQCGALRTGGEACRHCGFLPKRRADPVIFREGQLARVDHQTRMQKAATALRRKFASSDSSPQSSNSTNENPVGSSIPMSQNSVNGRPCIESIRCRRHRKCGRGSQPRYRLAQGARK